ncbi:Pyridine nucleotide-disulfide oxidoreductase dimerization region precursor (modular protein) [Hyphomicrobium denitrificans 1NES1]|uniref:TVP38/TMEM64 family membrane protein n=1 Tax=Hyphomicrobium denitrificans 1NES1 TaxID=670307 RepID=N0B4K3_9HYPH|nr:Pyridine nucleotide-disulfide oxidoreductase dimerization region precursor (modular protein) [Hyphomicrobium denitrificans 1NES1]
MPRSSHEIFAGRRAPTQRNWVRVALLPALIILGLAAFLGLHLDRYLTFEALAANRSWLLLQVELNPALIALAFAAVYIAAATLSLPGSSILTMSAGFLFGLYVGTAIAVVSATVGATLLFFIARTSFGEFLRGRALGALQSLKDGFQKSAFNYLLFLRLVPLFPFWLINLAAAFLDVPPRTFVAGTFLGIIPGAAVYASVGSGLGQILNQGRKPDLDILFTPNILIPILALAALSLVPVGYRWFRRGKPS